MSAQAPADPLTSLLALPLAMGQQMMEQMLAVTPCAAAQAPGAAHPLLDPENAMQWAAITARLQGMWFDDGLAKAFKAAAPDGMAIPPAIVEMMAGWARQIPLVDPQSQDKLVADSVALWEGVLAQWGIGPKADPANADEPPALPRKDRRFANAAWRETPYFTLVHQTYLILADQITAMADRIEGLDPARHEQLRFITRTLVDAMSPDHFPLTNPQVIEKAIETQGDSLVKGMEHLARDLESGQLTHADKRAFKLGENIAATPGKVVLRTRLFELLHYTPTTPKVDAVPLVIFPPWINRFYILDLNPQKSFVKWALDQGLSVFIVSWKSADASMADVIWDDYIAAQIEAVDCIRERLDVPAVHTIGYCVAGTTLAATLAILARRGEAGKVASATFFTAQVDFEKAGDLRNFIDDEQLAAMASLAKDGVMDGRFLAATFNLLRPNDLIWSYVLRNYLLGEDYPAFDLLYWNGDTTNLPALWHQSYLRDLYQHNLLIRPDALSACGTPIDLARITTPAFIQAGREDHIAPMESVWRLARALPHAPHRFVLAGSGHIAGVVNPPASKKYQYWTCADEPETLADFMKGATETPGSWWPLWIDWLRSISAEQVPATGKRKPGGRGDKVLGEAPGEYVRQP
jgi:polyhydroxyalkanoate synthase